MRIEVENTGGIDHLGDARRHEPWEDSGTSMRYFPALFRRWKVDVVVESSPPSNYRREYWHEVHWFVEADLGEFCQWAMQEYGTELVLHTEHGMVTVEIYDDYRE